MLRLIYISFFVSQVMSINHLSDLSQSQNWLDIFSYGQASSKTNLVPPVPEFKVTLAGTIIADELFGGQHLVESTVAGVTATTNKLTIVKPGWYTLNAMANFQLGVGEAKSKIQMFFNKTAGVAFANKGESSETLDAQLDFSHLSLSVPANLAAGDEIQLVMATLDGSPDFDIILKNFRFWAVSIPGIVVT